MIVADSIGYSVGGHTVLNRLSMRAEAGQITALIGPSGAGKTTALSILGQLLSPNSGFVEIDGERSTDWSPKERRVFWRDQSAFVYQDSGVIDDRSVVFNVTLESRRRTRRADPKDRVQEVLNHVGLSGRGNDKAGVLSGGEKQRLGIARALYKEARWVFADEPTASLDDTNKDMVMNLFMMLADNGTGVIAATHDHTVMAQAHRIVELKSEPHRPNPGRASD